MTTTIGYIIGSIASGSINRKLVNGLIDLAREQAHEQDGAAIELTEIPIDQVPLYDHESDDDYPAEAKALKEAIEACDGLLIATPEYNRSIPGALKNAIDWASRPYGENSFAGKPVGIVGASPGAIGTAMAQQHLRNILAYLDAPTLGQPEAFIEYTPERFDDGGRVVDDDTRQFLIEWLTAFGDWVDRFA